MGHALSSDSDCEELDHDTLKQFISEEYGQYVETGSDIEVTEEVEETDPTIYTEEFDTVDYIRHAKDYGMDPGRFIINVPGNLLRTDYKIGTAVRDETGGRINHAVYKRFDIERSVKSIRKDVADELPKEVELLAKIDHPCAYKILEIYKDHRSMHLVRSPIAGLILGDLIQNFT
jgi:hypothetical protein